MIRLVVSDIDGTLVPEGTDRLAPEMYEIIRELKKRDIIFAVASGRQYASMRHVFEPVADDIIFIAENGSIVKRREQTLSLELIDKAVAEELIRYLRSRGNGHAMLSTEEALWIETEDEAFVSLLRDNYRFQVNIVDDLLALCDRTNKISLYQRGGGIDAAGRDVRARFGNRLNIMVAGETWVDCMSLESDKGSALATIQRTMRIAPEETMAFGDNCNDIGMIRRAGESYAVRNAHPQLKEAAKYEAPPYTEDGVLRVIREKLL